MIVEFFVSTFKYGSEDRNVIKNVEFLVFEKILRFRKNILKFYSIGTLTFTMCSYGGEAQEIG